MGKKNENTKARNTVQAIIETPSGSRNKYAWDEERKAFRLKKVLPAGMAFPYNFGYIPGTQGGDGDPLDVLVLMDAPAFPGCLLECVVLGAIKAKEGEGNDAERNDRLIAAGANDSAFANIGDIRELPQALRDEIEAFFVNYNQTEGKKFKVLEISGAKKALRLLKKAQKAA